MTMQLGAPIEAGLLNGLGGDILGMRACGEDLVVWDQTGVLLFTVKDQTVSTLGYLALGGITDVCVQGYQSLLIAVAGQVRSYKIQVSGERENAQCSFIHLVSHPSPHLEQLHLLPLAPTPNNPSTYLLARSLVGGARTLETVSVPRERQGPARSNSVGKGQEDVRSLFVSGVVQPQIRATCSVTVDVENVLIGFNSGDLYIVPYAAFDSLSTLSPKAGLAAAITCLSILELEGGRKVVVAGGADGSAAIWDLSDWLLLGSWRLFASPLTSIVPLSLTPSPSPSPSPSPTPNASTHLALLSSSSPLALLSLLPFNLLFLLPGTQSPIKTLATSLTTDEICIVYSGGISRVWDWRDRELRRSMDARTARGVLGDGRGWRVWWESGEEGVRNWVDPFLEVDLRALVEEEQVSLPWREKRGRKIVEPATEMEGRNGEESVVMTAEKDEREEAEAGGERGEELVSNGDNSHRHLSRVRFLLGQILTFGLDDECDVLVVNGLKISRPKWRLQAALQSESSLCVHENQNPWTLSPFATAQRLMQIVALLRVFLNFPDTERYASELILFYASLLPDVVGLEFVFPALEVLTQFWFDSSSEIQQTARLLFGSYLGISSDLNVMGIVEQWQDFLPSRHPTGLQHPKADQAVLIIGLIAADKFKLLPPAVLKDVSTSLSSYLSDSSHPYSQAVATELCSRGFEIWQNYVDAMYVVRQLFGLATGRDPATPSQLRTLARVATLHIAGVNTPLFMTTLLADLVNATSAGQRMATMKLLGFMLRKKPLILYTSLPRLTEAVVKSLDPTVTSLRETVQQAATVILNDLVRTYPSIDFHNSSQRLAVGTHEGAAIVYDLRTATRLYVLEGHKHSITALSWSPDGRRLVSVSLEEGKAVVWKVGVGILSMFTPGIAPRQGSGGTATPFKTLEFNVGDEGLMTTAATLEWVAFEWPGERTTKLRIRETVLTFSV